MTPRHPLTPRHTVLVTLLAAVVMPALLACHTRQQASETRAVAVKAPVPGMEYSPTTLIILCDSTIGKAPLREAINRYGATIIYDYHIVCGMAIRKPKNMTLEQAAEVFRRVKGVVSVEKDRIIRLTYPVKPRTEVM